jgi:hypothetical protein
MDDFFLSRVARTKGTSTQVVPLFELFHMADRKSSARPGTSLLVPLYRSISQCLSCQLMSYVTGGADDTLFHFQLAVTSIWGCGGMQDRCLCELAKDPQLWTQICAER